MTVVFLRTNVKGKKVSAVVKAWLGFLQTGENRRGNVRAGLDFPTLARKHLTYTI